LRHAHAGRGELIQRIDLGVFPVVFLLLAAEAGGLADRARLAAAAHLAPFLILHACLEAALRHVLVDLGAAHRVTAAHHVHRRFLAAFQRPDHRVDDAVVNQRLQALGSLHGFRILRRRLSRGTAG